MTIAEVLRQSTLSARDSLSNLDKELERAISERDAADDRVKRSSTEITRHRAIEGERKKSVNEASERVAEAQRVLEEIERRRQEALETLLKRQEEHNAIAKSLREASDSKEAALADIRQHQKTSQDAEARMARTRSERAEAERALRLAVLQSLNKYLGKQAENLRSAFDTQEQRAATVRVFEEFKKARHADPEISRLSEQREELQKFLGTAVVPGVKEMLQVSLKNIENQLVQRFPGALTPPPPTNDSQIDDFLFYCNQQGKAVFLLPITPTAWTTATLDETKEDATKGMALVWHFLRELNLKIKDGHFRTLNGGWPVFESQFDLEDVLILQRFSVKFHDVAVMQYVLTAVPGELQEALTHEDKNG